MENKSVQRDIEDAQPFVEMDVDMEESCSGGCDGCCSGSCGTSDSCNVIVPQEQ